MDPRYLADHVERSMQKKFGIVVANALSVFPAAAAPIVSAPADEAPKSRLPIAAMAASMHKFQAPRGMKRRAPTAL